jgi:hypothetical protein
MGVQGGIAKAIAQMDKLHALLSEKHIGCVYPWPQQLLYNKEESRQVTIWREWCDKRCKRFLNHFHFSSLTSANIRTFSGGYSFGETFTTTH